MLRGFTPWWRAELSLGDDGLKETPTRWRRECANLPEMRRLVLITIAMGILLLWAIVPYGAAVPYRTAGPHGWCALVPCRCAAVPHRGMCWQNQTFGATTLETAKMLLNKHRPMRGLSAIVFLGLLTPLYPALVAALLLAAPRWFAARRPWVWIVEGHLVLLLSPFGWFWAFLSADAGGDPLVGRGWAGGTPVLYPALWLLPGFAALAGVAAIVIGVAPRGRVARVVLG